MVNVTLEGTVRKRTEVVSYETNKGGKYFSFYLFEDAESNIRLTAFNKCAESLFAFVNNNEYVQIANIQIKERCYQNVKEIQGFLTPTSCVSKIASKDNAAIATIYTPIIKLGNTKGIIDVCGMILQRQEVEKIMKDGTMRSMPVITLRDTTAQVDVTFWEHGDKITQIAEEELLKTSLALESVICK